MRASDLIGATVVDVLGRRVGRVHDLRLRVRQQRPGGPSRYLLTALECGRIGLVHRLGYASGQIAGPWPLAALLRLLARGSVLVPWRDITRVDGRRIEIRLRREQLRDDHATGLARRHRDTSGARHTRPGARRDPP